MHYRPFLAACLLIAACGGLVIALRDDRPADGPAPPVAARPRLLPGIQPGGEVQLPNLWSLRPAGKHLPLGDFPVNLALHPSGKWLAVLHAGYGTHEVAIVDLTAGKETISTRVTLPQTFYGLAFSPDGKTLYASGGEFEIVHALSFEDGLIGRRREIAVAGVKETFVVAGLALDPDGKTLFAAGPWGQAIRMVPLADPPTGRTVKFAKDSYPYTCLPLPDGKRLLVSLWGGSAVAVVDRTTAKVTATWKTQSHPTEMALSPDGKTLFVSCANSTQVSVLDVSAGGKSLETINCALYPTAPSGNTPNSLCLTPDGEMLFVANADANNLAVFNVAKPGNAKPLGFIPTGWYPTSVRYNPADKRLYVANGKGLSSRANPQGPGPYARRNLGPIYQYIAGLMRGTLGMVPTPTVEQMAVQQGSLSMQPAASRRRRGRRCRPRTTRSRGSSARRARSSTAFTSSRRTAPTIRSSATSRRATAIRPCACSPRRRRPTTTRSPGSSCCSTISTSRARCPPTAMSGRWPLTPPTSWRRSGR